VTRGVVAALVLATSALAPVAGPVATPACAAGSIPVAVVVDFSGVAATTSTCVAASSRDTGATALAARARVLGRPAPRYSASGLLCAIDGYPADGCGVRDGGSYAYWAYYLGRGDRWEYANGGPAGRRISATTSEGWRWHPAGTGTAADPVPRAAADSAALCRPTPTTGPVTSTTDATPDVPAPPPSTRPPASAPTGTPPASGPTTVSPRPPSAPSSTADAPETSTSRAPAAPPVPPGTSDGGSGVPRGLVGGALVVALGVVGFVISRRRRRS